jgi:hypothetical protein
MHRSTFLRLLVAAVGVGAPLRPAPLYVLRLLTLAVGVGMQ